MGLPAGYSTGSSRMCLLHQGPFHLHWSQVDALREGEARVRDVVS